MRDGVSSVLSVSAEAGAGKTRLFEEVRSRLSDDVVWVEGRAHQYTSNVPYAPIVDMLSRVAGIDEADGPDVVRPKLESLVDGLVPGDVDALAVVNQLFGVQVDRDHDVEVFGEKLTTALGRLLSATASRWPTVVCFQDLHWVDPSTAELIRTLARDVSPPRVTICNFRPSAVMEIDGARRIELGELSPRETRAQLASLLYDDDPPDELVRLVLARAGGNPFFAEEIVNSLLDQALLTVVDGERVLSADGAEQSIPATVRGLLASRIDMLDPQRKQVLREASVVGREFLHRIVRTVANDPCDLDGSLALLTEVDLIRVKEYDPELEYIFKHALIQEVAKRVRSLVTANGSIARWLCHSNPTSVIGQTRSSRPWRSTTNAAAMSYPRFDTSASQEAKHSRRRRSPRRTATTAAPMSCSPRRPCTAWTGRRSIGCSSRRCSTGLTRSTTRATSETSGHFRYSTKPWPERWEIRVCPRCGTLGEVSPCGSTAGPSTKPSPHSKKQSRRQSRAAT